MPCTFSVMEVPGILELDIILLVIIFVIYKNHLLA